MQGSPLAVRATTLLVTLASGALLGACGAGVAFDDTFPDSHGERVASVLARLEAHAARAHEEERASQIVVALTEPPARLVASDLGTGSALWEAPVELASTPELAGRSVVTHEGSEIVVRSLESGRVTARFGDHALQLVGAAGEGEDGIVVLSTGGAVGASSVLVGLRGGATSFTATMSQAVGAPAVSAGMAFVPWAHQNLSVVDLGSGSELARVRATRGVAASARVSAGHAFFGQASVAPLGASGEPSFTGLAAELPGTPQLLRDAYRPPYAANGAQHRVRLVYRPIVDGQGAGFDGGTIYLVFYRQIFALTDGGAAVRWVRELPSDVVGAELVDAGLFVFDADGGAHLLSVDDGREVWSRAVGGGRFVMALASVGGLTAGAPTGSVTPLRDQLLAAAASTDARIVPARELAVRLLAGLPDEDVTANVLALCDDPSLTPSVRRTACDGLAMRATGPGPILAALDRHASFLRGVPAPPVGALARAALAMNARAAVPLLAAHLRDPETSPADLVATLDALARFGDASVTSSIADFIRLYHAESPDAGLGPSLASALRAYRVLAGPTSRELLEQVRDDALALDTVRRAASGELAALDAPATASAPSEPTASAEAEASGEARGAEPATPAELTSAMVQALLEPSRPELQGCLRTSERVYRQARVVLVVDPSGSVLMVTANPSAVQACVEPIVRRVSYPATRARARQQVVYDLRR